MSVLSRRNERLQRLHAAVTENQQKRHVEAAARQQRMTSIDTAIDQMQAEIADQTISIDYDASQLLKKFGYMTAKANDDVEKESKPLPCLGQRAHWIDCQRKYAADSRPCNFYVAALEECVTRTIGNSALAAAGAKT